jgi:hypothetical protein
MALGVDSVPRLAFAVRDAARVEHTAVPTLRFTLEVEAEDDRPIRSVALDVQVQIATRRRDYEASAHDRLFELFGPVADWGTTLRTLLWTRSSVAVPPFSGVTTVPLDVTCTYDLEVAASRYFDALPGGDVPLEFLFSGTVFYAAPDGRLQTGRISWEAEAQYRLPVAVWKDVMQHAFPDTAWIRVRKDSFDRLCAFKSRNALATWDDALDALFGDDGHG